jgi:hypothetical protein
MRLKGQRESEMIIWKDILMGCNILDDMTGYIMCKIMNRTHFAMMFL